MRNITVFTGLVIMVCAPVFVFAQEKQEHPYTFSSSTGFGIFVGQVKELVYPPSGYKAALLSELVWDIKPVFYYSLLLDFSQRQPLDKWGFFSNISLKNGIPGKSGKMEDRDWMSAENDELTHFSTHDNYTNELFFADVSAGFSFPLGGRLLLKPYMTLSYMRFNFSGQFGSGTYARVTGTGVYAPIDDSPDYVSFSDWEKVINYSQNWLVIAPAVSLGYYFLNYFYAELLFKASPWVFCAALDEHLIPDRYSKTHQYRDYVRGGIFLEPAARFSFFAGKRLELSQEFSWQYINGTKGETWAGSPIGTNDYFQQGEAGAGLSIFHTGIYLKIRL
jgi:outer membrane protease